MSQLAPEAHPQRHRPHEDLLAILLGTLLMSLGVTLYAKATLVTGGAAGLALLIQIASGWDFGLVFVALNLPFAWLALRRMGPGFTLRTALAVALVALFAWATPRWLSIAAIDPVYASVAGGGAMGVGLLVLARHRTAAGGVNILALYLQERHGLRAGWVQLGIDAAIFLAAGLVLPFDRVAVSALGTLVLNAVLGMNHKPGRYMAVS
jgi:uncharacterized membrane-anchored protein YitT (DUF2179 family)